MELRAFAGRFEPHARVDGHGAEDLHAALVRDGPAQTVESGPFQVAWTPRAARTAAGTGSLCLIDGRPRVEGLAHELGLDPESPPEQLVAEGYRRLGDAVLESLRGEFSLILWDAERSQGLLARDRLGLRPLFVAEARGGLLFASEVRNLLALLGQAPPPDPEAMAHWLARSTVSSPRTLYSGIDRVPAAHVIGLAPDGWKQRRYWAPTYAEPSAIATPDAAAAVRTGLERAVARSLAGATRPALMLSGGLDSAAVAAVSHQGLRAYSAVFPGDRDVDESVEIARVREWLAIDGVEAEFDEGSALAAGAEFVHEWELPSVSPNLFIWLPLLRRAAADGVDVMLDGEGGDELFGCAYYLIADRLRQGRPLAALRVARGIPGMGERPRARWLGEALTTYGVRGALPYRLHDRLRRQRDGAEGPSWLGRDLERLRRARDDPWGWKRTAGPRWWANLAHRLTVAGDAMGAPDQLRRAGRMAGVEPRHPLRDLELIDLVLRLPPELAFDPKLDRPLMRRALVGALPDERLQEERKPAFNSLLARALAGRDAPAVRRFLDDPDPELARGVRLEAVATMLDTPSGSWPATWPLDLWRIVSVEMWLEHRSDRDLPRPSRHVGRKGGSRHVR